MINMARRSIFVTALTYKSLPSSPSEKMKKLEMRERDSGRGVDVYLPQSTCVLQ